MNRYMLSWFDGASSNRTFDTTEQCRQEIDKHCHLWTSWSVWLVREYNPSGINGATELIARGPIDLPSRNF